MSILGFLTARILTLVLFWAGLVVPWEPVSERNVAEDYMQIKVE